MISDITTKNNNRFTLSNGFHQSFGKDEKGVAEKEVSFKEDVEVVSTKNS